ncbi:hypothetical protein EMIT0357P_90177 [Pseudomonas marginalis]
MASFNTCLSSAPADFPGPEYREGQKAALTRVQKSISPSAPKDLSQPHLKAVINAHSS